MELSPQRFYKTFEDEFSCKIKLSNFHCRLCKQRTIHPCHPGAEMILNVGSAPRTLIAPLTVLGRMDVFTCGMGRQWVCVLTQYGAGQCGKGPCERLLLKRWTVWLAPCPDLSLHILLLDCECSYKVIYIFAFC